jgi:hypothetical protein
MNQESFIAQAEKQPKNLQKIGVSAKASRWFR